MSIKIPELILGCAAYYKHWEASPAAAPLGQHHSRLEVNLRKVLKALSTVQESIYPGWIADPKNPGYLIQQNYPLFLRVPVHLLTVFPTANTLNSLCSIANRLKTHDSSIIYLSGSNAVRQIMEYVSDIDFCEYIPIEGQRLSDCLLQKLDPTPYDICIRLKFATSEWEAPFRDRVTIGESLGTAQASDPAKSTFKIDFVSKAENRSYDVSTVGIVCDDKFKSTGFPKTFAFQEAQVTPTDWVPNTLSNALEVGRYVWWLIEQIRKYREEKNYGKALKRSLSLTRVCWIPELSEYIKSFFENTTILIEQELREAEALKQKIRDHGGAEWAAEVDKLDHYLQDCRLKLEVYKQREQRSYGASIHQGAEAIISRLATELAGRSLGSIRL